MQLVKKRSNLQALPKHPFLVIEWSGGIWPCRPSRPGSMCGTTRGGQYKKCGMVEDVRAQRGRARSALFWRVSFKDKIVKFAV